MHVIIFITFKVDDTVIKHFNQLKNDLKNNKNVDIWMAYNCSYDECSIDHDKIFYYNKEILEKDGFKLHYYYWKNFGDFYGHNNDLVMIDFFNNHNEYDRYWFIDYDVVFTGDWNNLITYFNDKYCDLICSNLLWNHKIDPCFKVNPIGIKYDITKQLHGFTSIIMLSKMALEFLLRIYKIGAYGFLENFFPTALYYNDYNDHKFILDSFNEHGFVDGYSQDDNSTMNCKNYTIEEQKLFKKNKLYHAVKNESSAMI